MYSSRPARPPSSAYQYNPQAVDDVDDRDIGDNLASVSAPSIISSTRNYLHGNQAYDPYEGGQPSPMVHGNYGRGGDVGAHGHGHGGDNNDDDPMEGGIDEATIKLRQHSLVSMPSSNYKPTPLRWPFLATLMVCIFVCIGLVVYAHLAMPNSQSTATVRPGRRGVHAVDRPPFTLGPHGLKGGVLERRARAPNNSFGETPASVSPVVSLTSTNNQHNKVIDNIDTDIDISNIYAYVNYIVVDNVNLDINIDNKHKYINHHDKLNYYKKLFGHKDDQHKHIKYYKHEFN
ncbi:hypothetical protein SEUCBS139899_001347 [Sporothrix eucalyptigena]|uniref:Uncharacterized protein n=1 Tax=Sporothrix eucalyptigena TaxID=1812306 RepID=A0ABP0CHW1_9PEZI